MDEEKRKKYVTWIVTETRKNGNVITEMWRKHDRSFPTRKHDGDASRPWKTWSPCFRRAETWRIQATSRFRRVYKIRKHVISSCDCVTINNIAKMEGKMQPRPQGAFPWLWRWDSKAREKTALGTRLGKVVFQLAMVSNIVRTSAKNRYFPLIVMCLLRFCPMF